MYRIAIKMEGLERRKKSTGLMHLISGFFLIVNAGEYYQHLHFGSLWPVLPVYLTALVSLAYGFLRKRFDPAARYNRLIRLLQVLMFVLLGILLINAVSGFRILSLALWAAVCLMLSFTEKKAFEEPAILLDQDGVVLPGFFSGKEILWSEIENVVVRPDFITLYYPGNRYSQYELLQDMAPPEIEKVNLFCRQKINEAGTKLEVAERKD